MTENKSKIEDAVEVKANERNTIYEDRMYNEERKNRFLSQYPEGTQTTYKRIFLISRGLEETWEKDLVDFNLDELKELFHGMRPLTTGSSKANIATVYAYIRWAIQNGYRMSQSNIHPLDGIRNNKKFINEFIDKNIQLFISKQTVDDLSYPFDESDTEDRTYLINSQDSAIIQALFNGISTQQLQYMRKEDINEKDNTVVLRNEDGSLIIDNETGEIFQLQVSNDCIELLMKAAESKFYHFRNGEPSENAKMDSIELVDNDYVIRVGKTRNRAPLEPVAYHVISQRVKAIAEWIGNPYLTPKNITKSGHIYEGYKLWVEAGKPDCPDGKLTTEQYYAICRKFNFPKFQSGKYTLYNTNTLRDYVNLTTFKQLYEL